ncbi:hypothetical protein [Sphingorhabdus sp.]|uniref:hypothetical protein n=1 Tax=Sphingorhabdus sp. TaxID=1902408 RepID=UPI00391B7406
MKIYHIILPLALLTTGCSISAPVAPSNIAQPTRSVANISDAYIRLTLEAGTHEAEYVDAYYGPPALQTAAKANPRSLVELVAEARALTGAIDAVLPTLRSEPERRRARALRGMLVAADTRLQMLQGKKFSFNDEAKGQFATVPDLKPLAHYDAVLANLETLIPGNGALAARVDAFNESYTIPKERLQRVFDAAIAECKRRTAQFINLPAGETFVMEFVTGKPWSGYNYYKGNYKSLIQINTDLPIRISRAVDLGCHEGYPGHHVLNLMVEERLARKNGWREYEVNPLYSPTSVLSEGSANYGIDLAFPAAERLAFERDVLYPLAGLDPKTAEAYWKMQQMTETLSGARLTIAKMYLDGEVTRPQALELTQKYLLLSPARAEQSVKFTDHYRSYVINYGWGKDLVRDYIERGNPDSAERWRRMEKILSEPTQPSDLLR